jgi:hypothetical protein
LKGLINFEEKDGQELIHLIKSLEVPHNSPRMSRSSFGDSFKSVKNKVRQSQANIDQIHVKLSDVAEKEETDKEVIGKDGPGEEEKNGDYDY